MSSPGRLIFGGCLLLSWGFQLFDILGSRNLVYTRGTPWNQRLPRTSLAAGLAAMTLIYLAALAAFTMRRSELWAGGTMLLLLAAARQIHKRQWPKGLVIRLGSYSPAAAALLGYLCAFAAGWNRPPASREHLGWEAACGVIAGAYALTTISKTAAAGASWWRSENLGLLIAERRYSGAPWLQSIRRLAAESPRFCASGALLALLAEASAMLFVFPWARWPLVAGLISLKAGIFVLLGYVEIDWVLLVVSLAISAGSPT